MIGALLGGIGTLVGGLSGAFGGTQRRSLLDQAQRNAQMKMIDIFGGQLGQGVPAYGGQIAPDATFNQQLAFDAAPGLLASQRNRGAEAALRTALSGQPAYQIDPASSAAYYNDAVLLPAQQQFQDTLQGLDARYGARFGRSGGQQEAAHRAAEQFNTNLAGIRGDLVFQDEQARRAAMENAANRQFQGIGAAAGYSTNNQQNLRANLATLAGLGGDERSIYGQQNAEQYGKWEYAQPYNNPWLGLMSAALTPAPYENRQYAGPAAGVGGILSGLGSIFGGFGG